MSFFVRNRSRGASVFDGNSAAAQRKPSLIRKNSKLGTASTGMSSMTSTTSGGGRRKSITVDSNDKLTFSDIFLSDVKGGEASKQRSGAVPLVPLPPDLLIMSKQISERSSHAGLGEPAVEQDVIDLKLQNYWKTFASFPESWPELVVNQERLKLFIEQLNDAWKVGLNHFCSEQPRFVAYCVICSDIVGLRSEPSISQDCTTGEVLYPGQLLIADSVLHRNKVRYLKVRGSDDGSGSSWVFERKGAVRCLAYASFIQVGLWWYRVVSQEYAEVRRSPSFSERVRTGFVLCPGEVCVVALRCVVDDNTWFQLADGRGWIFEMRPPNAPRLMETADNDLLEVVMEECTENTIDSPIPSSVYQGPVKEQTTVTEIGMWEYEAIELVLILGTSISGWVLQKGERVIVDVRVPANGQKPTETSASKKPTAENRIWLRLSDGRGWVPKTDVNGMPLLKFVRMATPGGGKLIVKKGRSTVLDVLSEDTAWMQGIA